MIEKLTTLAIFGSFVWFCVMAGLLIIIFFWSENAKHGGIAFLGLVSFLIINYLWGNVPVKSFVTWPSVLIYLGVGLIYAIIRTYFYGRRSRDRDSGIYYLKNNVFRWWLLFPISLINWLISDLLEDIWDWTYGIFESTFEYFFKLGQKSTKKE